MKNYFSHETAIIESQDIGEGTKIWAFTHISKNAKIGKNCNIGEGVYIGCGVTIGDNVKIQNHSLLYEGVTIEDDVFIGPNVITTNDIFPRASSGDWSHKFRKTLFKKGCSVGANSTIVCGIEIGTQAMIGAGSVVTKSVSDETLVYGNPAKPRKKVSDTNYDK